MPRPPTQAENYVPEVPTAEYCFTEAAQVLQDAERTINNAGGAKYADDIVHATVAIAKGWAFLGGQIAGAPTQLYGTVEEFRLQGDARPAMTFPMHARGPFEEATPNLPPMPSVTGIVTDVGASGTDPHVHVHSCNHAWVRPTEPCANGCGTRPDQAVAQPVCPATCPDMRR